MNTRSKYLTHSAIIASLYIVLSLVSNAMGLCNGTIQFRLSEVLTILPLFTPAAIPGLVIGCALSNLITGCMGLDILFGTIATLLGALGTYYFGKKILFFGPACPIIANTVIVPFILQYVYDFTGSYWYFFATIGIGEITICGLCGMLLYKALKKGKAFQS